MHNFDTDNLTYLLGGILSIAVTLVCILQYVRTKSWSLWTVVLAATLESIGLTTLAYCSQHPSSHLVYVASLASTTAAPTILAFATFTTFRQLITSVISTDKDIARSLWCSPRLISTTLFTMSTWALVLFLLGIHSMAAFLSPTPITGVEGAIERLAHHQRAIWLLRSGYTIQLVFLSGFALTATAFLWRASSLQASESASKGRSWRSLLWALNAVNAMNLLQTAYKTATYAQQATSDDLSAESSWAFWLCDALPLLAALVILCVVHPGPYLLRQRAIEVHDKEQIYHDEC